jgi:hypothetical protein
MCCTYVCIAGLQDWSTAYVCHLHGWSPENVCEKEGEAPNGRRREKEAVKVLIVTTGKST